MRMITWSAEVSPNQLAQKDSSAVNVVTHVLEISSAFLLKNNSFTDLLSPVIKFCCEVIRWADVRFRSLTVTTLEELFKITEYLDGRKVGSVHPAFVNDQRDDGYARGDECLHAVVQFVRVEGMKILRIKSASQLGKTLRTKLLAFSSYVLSLPDVQPTANKELRTLLTLLLTV